LIHATNTHKFVKSYVWETVHCLTQTHCQ